MARYPNGPSRYDNCKNSDLQHMLKNRGIQHTGNKARLIERLKLDDRVRPFKFLNLPAELRNRIYRLAMNQDAISKSQSISLDQANRHNTAQPALFRICRQTRQETFRLHYQERHFSIVAESLDCAMYLLDWLDAIGEEGRQSIRHLKFHFSIGYLDPSLSFMERVHSKLSDDACVEYCGYAVKMLSVGRRFERKYPKATLALRAHSMPVEHACLKFFPRMAWFGSGPKEPSDCGMQPAMFICETPRGP